MLLILLFLFIIIIIIIIIFFFFFFICFFFFFCSSSSLSSSSSSSSSSSFLLLLLLLLLIWNYSPMWSLASLMDFSRSAPFYDLPFKIRSLTSINIRLHTVLPSVFWSSCQSTSLRTIVKYLTYFLVLSIQMHVSISTNLLF